MKKKTRGERFPYQQIIFLIKFILENNFYKLATLNKQNIDPGNPLPSKALPQLILLASGFENIGRHPLSHIDRVAYMISSLNRINEMNTSSEANLPHKSLAVAMLYIIAGTCARDLSRTNDERLQKFYETAAGQTCLEIFVDLNNVRKKLAHDSNLRNTPALTMALNNINATRFIQRITPHIQEIANSLGQVYQQKSVIPPPTMASTAIEAARPKFSQ